jgi:hypothetical protein
MSYLLHSLQKFGFNTLEEVTTSTLKRAFKRCAVINHPDKGGDEANFDEMLSSYLYLCETLHRINGGRSSLQIVDAPERLREQRANQYMNELFDDLILESEDNTSRPLPPDFHDRFAAEHVNLDAMGYAEWLQADRSDKDFINGDTYADITIAPFVEESQFHQSFEELVVKGKPPVTQSVMLHPDEMGYSSNSGGYTLVRSNQFTSDAGLRPEYTDVRDAFTTANTVYDKLSVPVKERTLSDDSLAELIKIREEVYTCTTDADAAAIAEYEKKRIDEQTEHKKKLDSYFKMGVFLKDSESGATISGATISGATISGAVTNVVVVPDEKDDFIKKF